MMLIVVCCVTIALSGGFIVGVVVGTLLERERAVLRRPPAPHEALARVYRMPAPGQEPMGRFPISGDPWYPPTLTPPDILAELRGPLPSRPDPSLTERVPKRGPA